MDRLCLIFDNLDRRLALLGIFILAPIILLFFSLNKLAYGLAGLFLLASCLLWLLKGKTLGFVQNLSPTPHSKRKFIITAIIFYLLWIILVISLYLREFQYERPIGFFFGLTIMAILLGVQISNCSSSSYQVLFVILNIILSGIMVSWPQLIIFPDLIGVDPFLHETFTESIVSTGYIPLEEAYSSTPLYHIFISITSCLLGLSYKPTTILSVSLAQIIVNTFFIYLIGKSIFKNHCVGLLASLLLVFSNYHILRVFWSIPNSFAVIFIPIALFLTVISSNKMHFGSILLALMTLITLVITHSLTSFAMIIILSITFIILFICDILITDKRYSKSILLYLAFYATFLFAWWTYASTFTGNLSYRIKEGFHVDFNVPLGVTEYTQNFPYSEVIISYLPEFTLFSLAMVGFFYVLHHKNIPGIVFASSGSIILMISFISPLLGAFIIPDRWRFMGQVLLVIFASIAIIAISSKMHLFRGFFTILLGLIVFFMVISPTANPDNFIFVPNSEHRYALTESEISAINTVSNIWGGKIGTDEYPAIVKAYMYDLEDISQELISGDFNRDQGRLILIRDNIVGKPFWAYRATYRLTYNPTISIPMTGFDHIYDSNSVNGYYLG